MNDHFNGPIDHVFAVVDRVFGPTDHLNAPTRHVFAPNDPDLWMRDHFNGPIDRVFAVVDRFNAPTRHVFALNDPDLWMRDHSNGPIDRVFAVVDHFNAPTRHVFAPNDPDLWMRDHSNGPIDHVFAVIDRFNAPSLRGHDAFRWSGAVFSRLFRHFVFAPLTRYTDFSLMLFRRLLALGVIVSLFLVPALARAGQALDFGTRPTAAASFTKSFDFPPDLVVVVPDETSTAIDSDQLRHPAARDVAIHPETLPNDPDFLDADSLRGPPSVARS